MLQAAGTGEQSCFDIDGRYRGQRFLGDESLTPARFGDFNAGQIQGHARTRAGMFFRAAMGLHPANAHAAASGFERKGFSYVELS